MIVILRSSTQRLGSVHLVVDARPLVGAGVVLPGGPHVGFGYDPNGNMTSLTTPLEQPSETYFGQDHAFSFTPVDLTSVYTPPADGLSSYATNYTYDFDRFLTTEARPDGTVTRTADSAGRLSTISQPASLIAYAYDSADRVTGIGTSDNVLLGFNYDGPLVTRWIWSGALSGSVSRTYDSFFRVASEGASDGTNSESVSRTYDADGLLMNLASQLNYTRDGGTGFPTSATFGNLIEAYTYDAFGALSSYAVSGSGNVYKLSFDPRDALGRITKKYETVTSGSQVTTSYGYNPLGRLVSAGSNSYAYDADGNRTTPSATYDAQDRLTTFGSTTYGYTSNGDLASKTTTGSPTITYVYDLLGNLRSVSDGTNTVSYAIDGANHRVIRSWNGTAVQEFLYADDKLVAELTGSGSLYALYVWGARPNVPEYMILQSNGAAYRFVTDHLGSVRLVVDGSGNVQQRIDYDEFGNATVVSDARTNSGTAPYVLWQPFGFAGGIYDAWTKLVRFAAQDHARDARGERSAKPWTRAGALDPL